MSGIKIYNVYNRNVRMREGGVFSAPELIVDAGKFIAEYGGYYAGANIVVGGIEYMIIVAPKAQGEALRAGRSTDTNTPISQSKFDGRGNLEGMKAYNPSLSLFPAANFCDDLDINGFTDWHWPSPNELEACYRFLKPTTNDNSVNATTYLYSQTNGYNPSSNPTSSGYTVSNPSQTVSEDFKSTGSEAFGSSFYSASYLYDAGTNFAQGAIYFLNGLANARTVESNQFVRAVRWVEV